MTAKRALVTGCNGFVGGYLCRSLVDDGYDVHGIDLQDRPKDGDVLYSKIDLCDADTVSKLMAGIMPDEVYHLAAVANPRVARENPALAYRTSFLGILNLLESCRSLPKARLLVVGSSEQYRKKTGSSLIYTETDELDSTTVYGSTKIVSESAGKAYAAQFGVGALFTRSFNHTGPGQSPDYVLPDFARQCVRISSGLQEPVFRCGNVDVYRDFLDVRDVVDAYRAIVAHGLRGETYNVASSEGVLLKELVEMMLGASGVSGVRVEPDPSRIRPGESLSVTGDNSKLRELGWKRNVQIERTVADLLDYWKGVK